MERKRREWDGHVTTMGAERLVKIPRKIYLPEEGFQDGLKEDRET